LSVSFRDGWRAGAFLESGLFSHGDFFTLAGRPHDILQAMQQSTAAATSPASTSFAGMLAALAAPAQRPGTSGDGSLPAVRKRSAAWSDDGLEDDIATLSYERALRAHARYRASDQSLTPGADAWPIGFAEPVPADSAAALKPAARHSAVPEAAQIPEPDLNRTRSTPFERNLKNASITIRMSKVECEQLHRRAADAGLSVSAYLRSCTFEAESLRAMVKDTLAELRLAKSKAKAADPVRLRQSLLRGLSDWLARVLHPWHGRQRVARA